jgi:hypothetical protein
LCAGSTVPYTFHECLSSANHTFYPLDTTPLGGRPAIGTFEADLMRLVVMGTLMTSAWAANPPAALPGPGRTGALRFGASRPARQERPHLCVEGLCPLVMG